MATFWWWFPRKPPPLIVGRKIDERFTDIADAVSSAAGRWQSTAVSLALMGAWIALGPLMHYSDSWQLLANTPTTWVELFLGLFMLAAANRVEKRNYDLHQTMARILDHVEKLVETEDEKIDHEETELQEILAWIREQKRG